MSSKKLLVILGPTASGKTRLAVRAAYHLNGEIISADSRQVFRKMDIGTGKDLDEYRINCRNIVKHLIDIKNPGEDYNVFEFQNDFHDAYNNIIAHKKLPVLCGGTGLYIMAVLKGFEYTSVPPDPELRKRLETKSVSDLTSVLDSRDHEFVKRADRSTRKRLIRAIEITKSVKPEIKSKFNAEDVCIIGLYPSREQIRSLISSRLEFRFRKGLIKETDDLLQSGVNPDKLCFYGMEYKFITKYLLGELSVEEMKKRLETAIHRFAKRQMTFFGKMEKEGIQINRIDGSLPVETQFSNLLKIWNGSENKY